MILNSTMNLFWWKYETRFEIYLYTFISIIRLDCDRSRHVKCITRFDTGVETLSDVQFLFVRCVNCGIYRIWFGIWWTFYTQTGSKDGYTNLSKRYNHFFFKKEVFICLNSHLQAEKLKFFFHEKTDLKGYYFSGNLNVF